MGEFELIQRYFTRSSPGAIVGVGDDCAILQTAPGMQLAISTDMLVEGRHFFPDVDPNALGHKALAVNLSDLAACGARPLAFTLALALPSADAAWLESFSAGLWALADAHGCELIGGDTTRGPLTLCITVFGEVPGVATGPTRTHALLRSGAQAGDDVYVSGTLGEAALGLQHRLGRLQLNAPAATACRTRLERPTPRVALGLALRGIASACADVSDGLLGDLGHILERSSVGAQLDIAAVLATCPWATSGIDAQLLRDCVLSGGDDYELVFTAAPAHAAAVAAAAHASGTPVQRIGRIDAVRGLRVLDGSGQPMTTSGSGFDHFSQDDNMQRSSAT
jgi:thiamine-monophosphate kinase